MPVVNARGSHVESAPLTYSPLRDFRELWRKGRRLPLEDYLAELGHPTLENEEFLDLIHAEIMLLEEAGELPSREEYLRRFPRQGSQLRTWFAEHQAFKSSRPISLTLSTVPEASSDAVGDFTPEIHGSTPYSPALSVAILGEGGPAAAVPDPSWPRVPGFDILGELGRGGMGQVFRAYDRKRRRLVAIKTMNRVGASALYRFKQEFRSLLGVAHRNLITLYELIGDGRDYFLIMELVDGNDFLHYLEEPEDFASSSVENPEDPFKARDAFAAEIEESVAKDQEPVGGRPEDPLPRALPNHTTTPGSRLSSRRLRRLREATRQLAEGVTALHGAGKLHRDIKPSNVLVSREGRVVLLDFGLVAEQDVRGQHMSTVQGLVGTVAYMAPEQAAEQPVSEASDWYAVGTMLYQALTGQLPFAGGMARVLADKQRIEPRPPRVLEQEVPGDLDDLCIALLRRLPEDRPQGAEVLRRLGGPSKDQDPVNPSRVESGSAPGLASAYPHGTDLVGRERHRLLLDGAFATMLGGRTVAVFLEGSSGAGKTALLQSFLEEHVRVGDSMVLSGRCYEGESVPYKAVDSLIDALSRSLRRLPVSEVDAVLPRDIGSLVRVFPVLRRVEGVGHSNRHGTESPDPQELRRRAFAALRELLGRLGDRHPLILAIDDLQWGDVDGALLLLELLRPPDAPRLLFLGAYRSEDRESSPFLQAMLRDVAPAGRVDRGIETQTLAVDPLTPEETRCLARRLLEKVLGLAAPDTIEGWTEAIERESGGNPFFVSELVRHIQTDDRTDDSGPAAGASESRGWTVAPGPQRIALEDVLWSRIRRLPADARQVLEVIAVSGHPLRLADLGRCVELAQDELIALSVLKAGRLIRSTGRAETDEVETYHDRVRETVVDRLDSPAAREYHRRLARALQTSGQADPETLGTHFLAAGEPERAVEHFARAADQAAEALAFARAARLYRDARQLLAESGASNRSYHARLGDALTRAGHGAEAAEQYLAAVTGATVAEALELQGRAAMQFLISGHIDQGLATLRTVLASVGMSLPGTPRKALISLLWQRTRLRARGLGFTRRDPSVIAPAELTRIDVCWSAGAGLSVVDTILGAGFQARGLLLSLRAGETARIARALAMEAAHVASSGGPNRPRTAKLLAVAEDLARQVELTNARDGRAEQPYPMAMVTLARGVSAYLEGRWRDALGECDQAERLFRDRCTGVAWEIDTATSFACWALSHLGELAELIRRWPDLLNDAHERGDLYATVNLSSYLMSVVRLAADQPELARSELDRNMARWSSQGYHVQHNDALWAAVQIALYEGRGTVAYKLVHQAWPALSRSLLLRVQFVRTSMLFLRARAALAAAMEAGSKTSQRQSLIRQAGRDASSLRREREDCPRAYATLIQGAISAITRSDHEAEQSLTEAIRQFDGCGMKLCAAAVGRRLGEYVGGARGEELICQSDAWMNAQGVRDPARMASIFIVPPR